MPHTDYEQLTLFTLESEAPSGWVYALAMGPMRVKIGWTARNPHIRAREMKGELLGYCPGSRMDETNYHKRLAAYRLGRTEDFLLSNDVMAAISEIRRSRKHQFVNWPNVP